MIAPVNKFARNPNASDTSGAGKSTARPAPLSERDEKIVWLCIEGKMTYQQIAEQFGMTDPQLRAFRKRLGLNLDPFDRIARFNRRNTGKTGRFAGLINSKNDQTGESSNRNAAPAGQSFFPVEHEATNAR